MAVPSDVIDDSYVAGGVVSMDALANNPARVIDAERCEKENTFIVSRDDSRAAAAVDDASLVASCVDRADSNI